MAVAPRSASDGEVLHFLVPSRSRGAAGRQGSLRVLAVVARGLPYSAFETLTSYLHVPADELNGVIDIPSRTAARRKEQNGFLPDESDRLFRFARVVVETRMVFGDDERAARWLKHSNRALGGARPVELLGSDVGVRQVIEVLNQMRYGIHS